MSVESDDSAELIEIVRGDTVWRFDREFLESDWTCIFGRGCQGILDRPAEDLQQGCCSLGAHFGDGADGQAEAMRISAYAEMIPDHRFQYAELASREGVFGDDDRAHTRVVDGACIFLNRPGFDGGVGCALHLAALDAGEAPIDWKPSVCWQLPLHVDYRLDDRAAGGAADRSVHAPGDVEIATVRRWGRPQWGAFGATMAWCCTERDDGGEAYCGDRRVIDSMRAELTVIAGDEVYVELRRRVGER